MPPQARDLKPSLEYFLCTRTTREVSSEVSRQIVGSAELIPSPPADAHRSPPMSDLSRAPFPTSRIASPPRDYGEVCSKLSPKATRIVRARGPPTASASPSRRFRE